MDNKEIERKYKHKGSKKIHVLLGLTWDYTWKRLYTDALFKIRNSPKVEKPNEPIYVFQILGMGLSTISHVYALHDDNGQWRIREQMEEQNNNWIDMMEIMKNDIVQFENIIQEIIDLPK